MILFDDFGEFFNQIPLGLILMVCASGLLLFGAFAWLAFLKPMLRKRRAEANLEMYDDVDDEIVSDMPTENTISPTITSESVEVESRAEDKPSAPSPSIDMSAMPDLDMLVGDTDDEDDIPEPETITLSMPLNEPEFLSNPVTTTTINDEPQPIDMGKKYRIPLHTGDSIVTEELVSVLRDPRDGRLVVYFEGTGYRTLVDSPDVKKEFVKIMRELSDVVTKPDENPPEEQLTPDAPVEQTLHDESLDTTPSEPVPPKRVSTTPPPPVAPDGSMPGDLPSFKLDDNKIEPKGKGLFGRPKFDFEAVEELDLAARIEAYLQHKLQFTPEYRGRDIHVHTAPGGGVRIQVDEQFFDAVGDVTDPDIRDYLSETIQEWQDRH